MYGKAQENHFKRISRWCSELKKKKKLTFYSFSSCSSEFSDVQNIYSFRNKTVLELICSCKVCQRETVLSTLTLTFPHLNEINKYQLFQIFLNQKSKISVDFQQNCSQMYAKAFNVLGGFICVCTCSGEITPHP